MKNPIKVLIADDQSLFREGLKTLLQTNPDFEVCEEAENGEEAVRKAIITQPDVILMDIRMPILNGIDATRRLRASLRDETVGRIIILTTFDNDDDVFEALRAGAIGYLLKDVASDVLFDAIHTAARGESFLQPAIASKVLAEFSRMPRPASGLSEELIVPLSKREKEILQLMATGAANKEIASMLMIAEGTVKNHVSSVLTKLDARDRMQAVIIAQRMRII